MNLARSKGYATVANAEKKLNAELKDAGITEAHHVIAVNDKGRYVPCVVGREYMGLIHRGITVLVG